MKKFNLSLVEEPGFLLKPERIRTSKDGADLLRSVFPDSINYLESFFVLGLNRGNCPVALYQVSTGGTTGTVVDIKPVTSFLLLSGCQSCILCHNHPGGKMEPSGADLVLTKKFVSALELFDIKVLDHIILSGIDTNYYSFADEGRI